MAGERRAREGPGPVRAPALVHGEQLQLVLPERAGNVPSHLLDPLHPCPQIARQAVTVPHHHQKVDKGADAALLGFQVGAGNSVHSSMRGATRPSAALGETRSSASAAGAATKLAETAHARGVLLQRRALAIERRHFLGDGTHALGLRAERKHSRWAVLMCVGLTGRRADFRGPRGPPMRGGRTCEDDGVQRTA